MGFACEALHMGVGKKCSYDVCITIGTTTIPNIHNFPHLPTPHPPPTFLSQPTLLHTSPHLLPRGLDVPHGQCREAGDVHHRLDKGRTEACTCMGCM